MNGTGGPLHGKPTVGFWGACPVPLYDVMTCKMGKSGETQITRRTYAAILEVDYER